MAGEFFPGSRQEIKAPPGLRDPLEGRHGKTFTIGGREIELFTISQVAFYLGRKPGTIRKWEHENVIPKATYVKPGVGGDVRGRRRLYSRAQVEALIRIATEENLMGTHVKVGRTQFTTKVFSEFRKIQAESRQQ